MIDEYISKSKPVAFTSPLANVEPIQFNTDSERFTLLVEPSISELTNLIDLYADFRREAYWRELMDGGHNERSTIAFFNFRGDSFERIELEAVKRQLNISSYKSIKSEISRLSIDEQRVLAAKLKPTNTEEMLSLYKHVRGSDQTGYSYFSTLKEQSDSPSDFFFRVIKDFLHPISSGLPSHSSRFRIMELLCMAWVKNWILFPFIYPLSDNIAKPRWVRSENHSRYFHRDIIPLQVRHCIEKIDQLTCNNATEHKHSRDLSFLYLSSTFKNFDQLSDPFIQHAHGLVEEACLAISPSDRFVSNLVMRSYNMLLKLRNEDYPHVQPLTLKEVNSTVGRSNIKKRLSEQSIANPIQENILRKLDTGDYSFKYLSLEQVRSFNSDLDGAPPIMFNSCHKKFSLIKVPSLSDVDALIHEHATFRREAYWKELIEPNSRGDKCISLFTSQGKQTIHFPKEIIYSHLGITTWRDFERILETFSIDQQRAAVVGLKPKNTAEMLAVYIDENVDETGFTYFKAIYNKCKTGSDFFGVLIDVLIGSIFAGMAADTKSELNTSTVRHRSQARAFELLGMAWAKGWLLFPFLYRGAQPILNKSLMHGMNYQRYFHEDFRPAEIDSMFNELRGYEAVKTTEKNIEKDIAFFVLSSTFRSFHQVSREVFDFALNVINSESAARIAGMNRRAYNIIIRLRNSKLRAHTPVKLLVATKIAVSLDDFYSMERIRVEAPHLSAWADQLEEFLKSVIDSSYASRKTSANSFADFILQLPNAPRNALELRRQHINDLDSSSNSYRNWLVSKCDGMAARNGRLLFVSQFYDFIGNKSKISDEVTWVPNPVDMKYDRFSEQYRAGTQRKTIAADIMATMRGILVDDDFEWSKKNTDWGNLVDKETGKLEYVWCPSSAILLYTLLTIPLRSIQARMFDSGEGDAEIYDFDLDRMVPNPDQLLIDGKLDCRRREGFLQVMASGMVGGGDILGLWVPVNKTSGDGYAIPWVSQELLMHLRFQRDWILRYADHPNLQTINDAQGHRNTPEVLADLGGKFFCLFRDAVSERASDHSLPVPKQKLMKLWGKLCGEAQRRLNASSHEPAGGHVQLVQPGTEDTPQPRAIHDIHTLRVSGITDLLDRGVPLNIVSEYIAGHATYVMTLWYDKPTPGAMRAYLEEAQAQAGGAHSAIPAFDQAELSRNKPHLVSHHDYVDAYNGFDALGENAGLALIRQSGICPGTRCSEGALDEHGRPKPVPTGDRGPSCPQCRFWLTGPAFLLGQTIEGNQLIYKIRDKTSALSTLREKIMDAEDAREHGRANGLRAQADVEERQLNDMLTEWWHRMRFYQASKEKLAAYRASIHSGDSTAKETSALLLTSHVQTEPDWAVRRSSELELKLVLSTFSELLPDYSIDSKPARLDIEMAVAKFLSVNHSGLAAMHFSLDDKDRLTAANLTVEMLLHAAESPEHAAQILNGREKMSSIPHLKNELESLFTSVFSKPMLGGTQSPLVGKA